MLTKIKLTRLKAGKLQIEVAQSARIARSRLSEIENGHVTPKPDESARLAAALGCPISALSGRRTLVR